MKLLNNVNPATLGNSGEVAVFKIQNSAKAFSILSSGLYSNKVKAIIRELSCNAVDSHKAAGKEEVPFDIHLPSPLEPWFSIRDYGTGLTGEQITGIYTTYFQSSKTESNDYIGALGLGSKSPFSYTENFTITSVKDGKKYIYSAFISEAGIPSVSEMFSGTAEGEPNGVEVKFSVTNHRDFNTFANEARDVFTWFRLRPNVMGVSNFQFNEIKFTDTDIIPGVHQYHTSSIPYRGGIAVMGNIAYSLLNVPAAQQHFGKLADLLNGNIIINFNIGELDFAASREELSYIPLTIASIKDKLEKINKSLLGYITGHADAIQSRWDRLEFLYEKKHQRLFAPAIEAYCISNKLDQMQSFGYPAITIPVSDMDKLCLSVETFNVGLDGSTYRDNIVSSTYDNKKNLIKVRTFNIRKDTTFVINDTKYGCLRRARAHFSKIKTGMVVHCISHTSKVPELSKKSYAEFLRLVLGPTRVVYASELDKTPAKKQSVPTTGILELRSGSSGAEWKLSEPDSIDDSKTYYYVELAGFELVGDIKLSADVLHRYLAYSGIKDLWSIKVNGVRKSRIKEIQGLSNWIPLSKHIKEVASRLTEQDILDILIKVSTHHSFDTIRKYCYNNTVKLGDDSEFMQFVKTHKMENSLKAPINTYEKTLMSNALMWICQLSGISIEKINALCVKLEAESSVLVSKYELLPYISSAAPTRLVANYITMVQQLEKKA